MTLAPHLEWSASHDVLDSDAADPSVSPRKRAGHSLDLARACADGLRFHLNKLIYGGVLPPSRRPETQPALVKEARVVIRDGMKDFAAAIKSSYLASPRKIICIYYNTAHPDAFEEIGIFPIRELVDCPEDACDRYKTLQFRALVFETWD